MRVDRALSLTLVGLDEWAASLLSKGFDAALDSIPGAETCTRSSELVGKIGEYLTKHAREIEADLLSKSVQETLFFCVGADPYMSRSQFKTRLTRFLRHRGTTPLNRHFLSLYFFNLVWFQAGESFRQVAWTPDMFVKEMASVERACRNIVTSTWKSQKLRGPIDPSSAEELIRNIAERLYGV